MDRLSALDPLAQTGFLNNYANGLALSARYEEALSVVDLEISLAKEFSVDFAVPHALLVKGLAYLGLRRFAESEDAFNRAVSAAEPFVAVAAATFSARLPLYRGRPGEALAILGDVGDPDAIPVVRAELMATKALAFAALQMFDDAARACEQALNLARNIETVVLVASAQAITALSRRSDNARALAEHSFRLAIEYGNLDSFVCAYRTHPHLLAELTKAPELEAPLLTVLARAHDLSLAKQVGVSSSTKLKSWKLTKREHEILSLVARGLTNREIAERLVVAEVTVKVHVRHILRKLAVRSRTEAAIRFAMTGED